MGLVFRDRVTLGVYPGPFKRAGGVSYCEQRGGAGLHVAVEIVDASRHYSVWRATTVINCR